MSKSASNKYFIKNTVDTVERFLYNTLLERRNDFSKLFLDKSSVLRNNVSTKYYQIISKFLEWENKKSWNINLLNNKWKIQRLLTSLSFNSLHIKGIIFIDYYVDADIKSFMRMINVDINFEDKLLKETIYIINDQLNRYEDDEELQNIFIDRLIE